MPSWNVHTEHVERLLREGSAGDYGVRDVNAFLFGNYLPDIHVGYLVPNPAGGILPYRATHFADPTIIPIPRERLFWDLYVEPSEAVRATVPIAPVKDLTVEEGVALSQQGIAFEHTASPEEHERLVRRLSAPGYRASDVVLGAWAHLLCDNVYNTATHAWLKEHGVPAGERTRIRKQGDFDLFGRSRCVRMTCLPSRDLIEQAELYPHYPVCEQDVRDTIKVADAIIADSQDRRVVGTPDYSLFTAEFFDDIFERAAAELADRLRGYAKRLEARS